MLLLMHKDSFWHGWDISGAEKWTVAVAEAILFPCHVLSVDTRNIAAANTDMIWKAMMAWGLEDKHDTIQ